jgi:hypothetical protein
VSLIPRRIRESRGLAPLRLVRPYVVLSPLRALPDYMVIGAQKSGTWSLYDALCQHPLIVPARRKETHYFSLNYSRGPTWYRSQFPLRRALTGGKLTGEATAYYLFHPGAPKRARGLVPHARLIVILRDPMTRAYSQYRHEVREGRETLSFEAALAAEEERLSTGDTFHFHRHSYAARGRYAEQLERWFGFFPREQFLILIAEEFFADPQSIVDKVAEWLGLPHATIGDLSPKNVGNAGMLDAATSQKLRAAFEPHNAHLAVLLGRELPW